MDLRQYLKSILRWWWLVLLSTTIAVVASYFASLQQPRIYQTTTTIMVGQVIQKANPEGSDFILTEQLAESYAQIARRQPVLQGAADALGLDISWQDLQWRVNAYSIPRTQLLGITVQDISPERAVAIADEIARQLILQSPASPNNRARQDRGQFVQNQLVELEGRIQTTQAQVKELRSKLDAALSAREIKDLQAQITDLETLLDKWQTTYSGLLNFIQGGDSPNYLTVIEPAQLSTTPISPNVKLNVLLAAAVGFMLAVGAAILLEYLDDTLKPAEDVSTSLGLTALGSIERIKGSGYMDRLITSHSPFSSVTESYRLVRSNIQFMSVDQPVKSIVITSSNPGEGKSMTAANLAIIMAQAELKTIIVDADLRRPTQHKIFGVPNLGGLTDLLRSPELELNSYMKNTGIENLQLLSSGPLPPNPAELLGSQRMAQLIQHLEQLADVIIFDSPPVLAVTDAAVLSKRAGGVILVTQAGRSRRDATRLAIKRLSQVEANLLGTILNQVSRRDGNRNQYAQYYSHSGQGLVGQPAHPIRRRWWQRLPVSLKWRRIPGQ
jgi:succinoglycan biosynthesis transport protein ExoP